MSTKEELRQLLKQATSDRQRELDAVHQKFDQRIKSIETVLAMLSEGNGAGVDQHELVALEPSIPLEEGISQVEAVRRVIKSDPQNIWTAPGVHFALLKSGYTFGASTPTLQKQGLSVIMTKLMNKGEIELVEEGKGNKPARYRAIMSPD